MTTEIHDTHTCPCEMCVWARETAANKPESPSESPETPEGDAGFLVPEAKNVPTGLETPGMAISAPTFTEEWESAPRAMIRYVEQSIAEYWFLRGVRAGETGAVVTMNEDLREIRRVAGERLTTTIREGR